MHVHKGRVEGDGAEIALWYGHGDLRVVTETGIRGNLFARVVEDELDDFYVGRRPHPGERSRGRRDPPGWVIRCRSYEVEGVRRAFAVLGELAAHSDEMGAADVARSLDMGRSTVFRMLVTLEGLGAVRQNPATRRYRLGPELIMLGRSATEQLDLRSRSATDDVPPRRDGPPAALPQRRAVRRASSASNTSPAACRSSCTARRDAPCRTTRAHPDTCFSRSATTELRAESSMGRCRDTPRERRPRPRRCVASSPRCASGASRTAGTISTSASARWRRRSSTPTIERRRLARPRRILCRRGTAARRPARRRVL